ncbi:MAG: hypothetical protein U9O94_04800 [Nanoarchaeota archaeon]|nr:hypothetical protein [Nanoarchaeota archaeon]
MRRYDLRKLEKVCEGYKKILNKVKGKTTLVILDVSQKKAFYTLAPLSKTIHELEGDMNVQVINKKSSSLDVLKDVWACYYELKQGTKNKKTNALKKFISLVDKKCGGEIKDLFKAPEIYLKAESKGFEGSFSVPYDASWFKEYREGDLLKTAKVIWNQVYDLKKKEKVSIGFDLLRKKKDLGLPIEDYLDSFQISYAMMKTVRKQVVGMGTSTSRNSQLATPERISELKATILGCELCKDVNEPIFKAFKEVSKLLRIDRLQTASAVFGIHGKGYSGKHKFGECVGYPSKNKKTRWLSPGQMIYKLDFYPQTALDPRMPLARVAFTETLPIDIFIKTSNINWLEMQKRDHKIIDVTKKCEYIKVIGKKFGQYRTKLNVGLVSKDGKRRKFRGSDVETRNLVNKSHLKETGIKAGTMANIPGGEAFTTPEYIKGQFIGDVVISIDQSYILNNKKPFVVNCFGNNYKIVSGEKKIINKFNEKKKEARKLLAKHEKSKSMPKKIIEINKRNFNNIGEFAINTNPQAELCNYLIVNEKIANMIHIALGSGFDPDRATYYHTDVVIDSPRQKLDIYGVDKNGKKHWIHKKGKFVI